MLAAISASGDLVTVLVIVALVLAVFWLVRHF